MSTITAAKPQAATPMTGPMSAAYKAAFAAKFDVMMDAIEALYIPGNQSGRIQFRMAWPLLAERIFGAELIGFDETGVTDRARRAVLEDEAEERRLSLLHEIEEIREKTIKNSMLELDYIKSTMTRLGRDMAALIYAENLVEKFLGAPPTVRATPTPAPQAVHVPEPVAEKLDEIAPIAMPEPVKAKPALKLALVFNQVAASPYKG